MNPWFVRIMTVIAIVVLLAVGIKLIGMMLTAILPAGVMQAIGAGAAVLYQLVAPGIPAFMALVLLWFVYWVVFGGRR